MSINLSDQLEGVRKALSGFKKYNPKLNPICGSVNATILFLELQWLRDCFQENHGISEFYHTDKQLKDSLGFQRRQLDNAKKTLLDRGLISYRVLGNKDKKTHYIIHVDKFMKCISEMYETYIPKCTKRTSPNVRNVHTKKNNKQDRYNNNNNKAASVDNFPSAPDASSINPSGAIPMKNIPVVKSEEPKEASVAVVLKNELIEIGIGGIQAAKLIDGYSEEYIRRKIALTKQKPRNNDAAWLVAAIERNYADQIKVVSAGSEEALKAKVDLAAKNEFLRSKALIAQRDDQLKRTSKALPPNWENFRKSLPAVQKQESSRLLMRI